ncbi:DUF7519 family protein [Halalkalicoccus subterraneus]|uniref:DUF7519 family protein n=1 Tax=Halalkalicoccus subterraneus TaxID=2675002 RepID=UPI000EFC757A|nr:hypothetical protein [Halalkalicoccus subterraneus]
MNRVDRSPAPLSRRVSLVAALVAVLSSGFYSWLALGLGAIGFLLLATGLARGTTRPVTLGAAGLAGGALAAGVEGAPVPTVLAGVAGAVLAWDVGINAIVIGRQLGREAGTERLEAVHAVASAGVGLATAGAGYGLYRMGTGEQPVAALVFLLVAAVLLLETLD